MIVYNVPLENYKKSKFKTYKSFASVTVTGSHKLVHKLAIISAKKWISKLISLNDKFKFNASKYNSTKYNYVAPSHILHPSFSTLL